MILIHFNLGRSFLFRGYVCNVIHTHAALATGNANPCDHRSRYHKHSDYDHKRAVAHHRCDRTALILLISGLKQVDIIAVKAAVAVQIRALIVLIQNRCYNVSVPFTVRPICYVLACAERGDGRSRLRVPGIIKENIVGKDIGVGIEITLELVIGNTVLYKAIHLVVMSGSEVTDRFARIRGPLISKVDVVAVSANAIVEILLKHIVTACGEQRRRRLGIVTANADRLVATTELIDKLITEDRFVLTCFYGKDSDAEERERLESLIAEKYPDIETYFIDGTQEIYPYIFVAE